MIRALGFQAVLAVMAGLGFVAAFAPEGGAAEPSIYQSTPSLNPDILYDYDLYVADDDPEFGWFVIYTFADDSTIEYGPYSTQYDASWRLWFNVEHNIHTNAVDVEIVELELPPVWQFVQRFGTYAAAADMAELFEQFNFLTDIRRVSALRVQSTTGSLSR